MVELSVKLPIETVLRRGQIAAVTNGEGKPLPTIVDVGPYRGLFGTMRSIIYEEGESARATKPASDPNKLRSINESTRKGQGVEGLWRGWRVGMWGLIGVWGAATLGGASGKSGEF